MKNSPMNRTVAAIAVVATLTGSFAMPVQAEVAPKFLSGIHATPLTQDQMEAVHGQGLPSIAVKAVVWAAKVVAGAAASYALDSALSRLSSPPPYSFYVKLFGSRAMTVINLVPARYRPMICNL